MLSYGHETLQTCHGDSLPLSHFVLFVGCVTSHQHACVSHGRVCSEKFTCCHTETEAADQTFRLTQSQYTDTGPTSSRTDPTTPGAWQGSHWSANVEVTGMILPGKIPAQAGFKPRIFRSRGHKAKEAVPQRQRLRHKLLDTSCCWLLNAPATCECISGTDLLRQFYVLPH